MAKHTINNPDSLLFVPGLTYPDSDVLELMGLSDFKGYINHVSSGPGGQCGWLLSQNPNTKFEPTEQTWLPCGSYWRGRILEALQEAA